MSQFGFSIDRFRRDNSGNLTIAVALAAVTIFGVVGLAVDLGRFSSAARQTEAALDSTAIMAAKLMNTTDLTDSEIKLRAKTYFESLTSDIVANGGVYSNFDPKVQRGAETVEVNVDAVLPSTFARVLGKNSMDFRRDTKVIAKDRRIELALILDVTGSMCNPCTKLDALKSAAKSTVDALYASKPRAGSVRVGLVPYSASVNLGGLASAATGGAGGPCVVERDGVDRTTETSPSFSAPFPPGATTNPGYSCPTSEVVPLQDLRNDNDRDAFKAQISSLTTDGMTAGHIGAAWGWYMVSDQWTSFWPSGSRPRSYSDSRTVKAVVLMTDGNFNMAYTGDNQSSTSMADEGSSANQALELCTNMRAAGVRVYTVAFQAPTEATELLEQCAGSTEHSYQAENAGELAASFLDIAEKLQMMRFSQ